MALGAGGFEPVVRENEVRYCKKIFILFAYLSWSTNLPSCFNLMLFNNNKLDCTVCIMRPSFL